MMWPTGPNLGYEFGSKPSLSTRQRIIGGLIGFPVFTLMLIGFIVGGSIWHVAGKISGR